jgi:serine/threonine protein kinase
LRFISPLPLLVSSYSLLDIFSFGIVLCEMITKQEPSAHFLKRTPQNNCFSLPEDELRAAVLVDCPESLEALTIECCNSEPDQRPTAQDSFEWLQVRRKQQYLYESYSLLVSS